MDYGSLRIVSVPAIMQNKKEFQSVKILTPDNRSYDLNRIPSIVDDIRFCVYETAAKPNDDYYFNPLLFLETYHCPAAVLKVGNFRVEMPLDWSVLVCDEDMTDVEMLPLTSLSDRGFQTLAFNPYHHMVVRPVNVEIIDVYSEVKWYSPKLGDGALLTVPLEDGDTPACTMFVKDRNKIPDTFSLGDLF